MQDTIAAISTPAGAGAIAVIRVSGPEAITIGEGLFSGRGMRKERVLRFGGFRHRGEILDSGMLAVFPGPRSYTGEDMAELHCHGGALVSARLLQAVLLEGARQAEPGEFTRRAFLNGKMDLTRAEAVMDVIRAATPRALRAAEEQLEGRLGREIEQIRAALLTIVAHLEAHIDFPEEGISPHTQHRLLEESRKVLDRIAALLATADEGRILREGVHLVLCGAPNAGKSSLLNRLLGFERAIVSDIPGTTRDTIEEAASLRGILFRITDTAGLRETGDSVESEGVHRARRAMDRADVVVRVVDATADPGNPAASEIVALNKCDLLSAQEVESRRAGEAIPISCVTGHGIERLVDAVVAGIQGAPAADSPTPAAINARHQACLGRAKTFLETACAEMDEGAAPELIAGSLRASLDSVGEVVGALGAEDILGEIFKTFCIGK